MFDFGVSGRMAGVSLLALTFGLAATQLSAAKDVPGRKRCFVAGVETYKDEPVYRDQSSGYQRVQVPGSKGERCFWEPLDYQAAAETAPVRPSRAAPSTMGRRARAEGAPSNPRPQEQATASAARPSAANLSSSPTSAPARSAPAAAAPARKSEPEPRQLAALPPKSHPEAQPQPGREPQPRAEAPSQTQRPAPQSEPVRPVLQPRGLKAGVGTSSGPAQDLRIQTRPVASGGTVSTISSGSGMESFMKEDRVVPEPGDPMQLAAAEPARTSMEPRTPASNGWAAEARAAEPSYEAPAIKQPAPAASPPPSPPPAAKPTKPAARKASPSSAGGGSFVQLGSVTSNQKAKQFWTDVTGRYPDELAGFSPNIVEADIPGKGIYYRVRVGPLDGEEAKALCRRLDGNCLVVSK